MPRKKAPLTPTEVEILKALRISDYHFTELKNLIGKTDRTVDLSIKNLKKQKFVVKVPGRGYKPYLITRLGKDALDKYEMNESIQDSSIYYSHEITFKVDANFLYEWREPYKFIQHFELFPFPSPVQTSFFGSERIAYLIDPTFDHHLHYDHAYSRDFLRMIEEDVTPLKPYLNDLLFSNCCEIGKEYEKYIKGMKKKKPKLDINVLDFNWALTLRFEGKKILDHIKKFSTPNVPIVPEKIKKLKKEMEERLIGTILIKLIVVGMPGSDSIIPAMVAGGLLEETEGKELQLLYEQIWGKKLEVKSNRKNRVKLVTRIRDSPQFDRERSTRQLLVKALEHLKKGNGLHITKMGRQGSERTSLSEDDVFKVVIRKILNPDGFPDPNIT